MNKVLGRTVVVLCLMVSGCVSNVTTDYDPAYDFTSYSTYQWHHEDPQPGDALAANPLARRRVVQAVDKALAEKGFRLVEEGPSDFLVFVHGMVRNQMQVDQTGGFFYFGGPFAFGAHRPYVSDYDEETVFVDIIDSKTHQLIWRGSLTRALENYKDPNKAQAVTDKIVQQILKDFPPIQE